MRTAEMPQLPWTRRFRPHSSMTPAASEPFRRGLLYVRDAGVYRPFGLIIGQTGARDPARYTVPNPCPNAHHWLA
jgi:hypothetical protein